MTKNLHIEHPEDSILTGDLSALSCLRNEGNLSVKMDGAPAIVWGINPATGNFFVGTKSVFNKVKIKINESHQDIDVNHTGNVATILHKCFDYLPQNGGIYQGDFIGFGGNDEYTPNTITYQFDNIVEEEIIIAPHTYYTAESDLRDAIAHPMKFIITDTFYCKFVKPKSTIASGRYDDGPPRATIASGYYDDGLKRFHDLDDVIRFAMVMAQNVEFVSDKEAKLLKQELNSCIRENRPVIASTFMNEKLISFWLLVKSIKEDAIYLCRNNGPKAYIGQTPIGGEGYVYSNEYGTIKLVNREQFSYANFSNAKFQQSV